MMEIERKFLVHGESWRDSVVLSQDISQGYMDTTGVTVRVRIQGEIALLTVKGPTEGISRSEYEYEIPLEDAQEMLSTLCGDSLHKTRHHLKFGKHDWTIDEFRGGHVGLIMAEIEILSEDEEFEIPAWMGVEVSFDPRYYNSNLIGKPVPK